MPTTIDIRKRLELVFNEKQAIVLSEVIASSYDELVKTSDFNELKGIVKDIAVEVKGLAQAQKRTEIELQKTQVEVQKTQVEVQKLVRELGETNQNLGGLSRSMGYAFENEAYRMLPRILKETYGIEMKEKLIRAEIAGKEINILGRAKMNGKNVVVIGEAKLRLDDRRNKEDEDIFDELEEKVRVVQKNYKEEPIKVLITHYATKGFMKKAKDKDVLVIQSFEW